MTKTKVSIMIEKDGKTFVKRLTHRQVRNLYDLKYQTNQRDKMELGLSVFAEAVDYIDEGLAFTTKGNKIVKTKYNIWHSGRRPKWKQFLIR